MRNLIHHTVAARGDRLECYGLIRAGNALCGPAHGESYVLRATLRNVRHPEFHAAFAVQPGDRMYRAPEDRVRIW